MSNYLVDLLLLLLLGGLLHAPTVFGELEPRLGSLVLAPAAAVVIGDTALTLYCLCGCNAEAGRQKAAGT